MTSLEVDGMAKTRIEALRYDNGLALTSGRLVLSDCN